MDFDLFLSVLVSVIGGVLAATSVYALRSSKRATKQYSIVVEQIAQQYKRDKSRSDVPMPPLSRMPLDPTIVLESGAANVVSPELLRGIEEAVVSGLAASRGLSKEDVHEAIDNKFSEVLDMVSRIESRSPQEPRHEINAEINTSLLSFRIDVLAKQVENLEKRVLTRWDVAMTCSAIVGFLAFVVSATYGVLKVFGFVL